MSLFMFVGVFATFISDEPKLKRNLNSDNHVKFLITIFIAVIGFIYLYSVIDSPFQKKRCFNKFFYFHYQD